MSDAVVMNPRAECPTTVERRPVSDRHLSGLVDDLAGIRDGREPAGRSGPAPARWADDDYVYLEAELPGSLGLEADLSIQSGHVFIRVARREAGRARPTA